MTGPVIKSVTWNTNADASATVSVTTPSTGSVAAVGDLVVVWHANDFFALTNMSTPTATGSPTMHSLLNVDGGTNEGHIKTWWYVVNTAGAQTITATETGTHDEEKWVGAIVYDGTTVDTVSPVDGTGSNFSATTNVTSQVLPSITTANANTLLHVINVSGAGTNASNYTEPAGMTEQADVEWGAFASGVVATEPIATAGATGTRTITANGGGCAWAGVIFGIKAASAGSPVSVTDTLQNGVRVGTSPATIAIDTLTTDTPPLGVDVGTSPATVAVGVSIADTSEPGVRTGVSAATVTVGTGASDSSMPGVRVGVSPVGFTIDVFVADSSSQGVRTGTSGASVATDQFASDTSEPGIRIGVSPGSVAIGIATADGSLPGVRVGTSSATQAIDTVTADSTPLGVMVGQSPATVVANVGASDTTLGGVRVGQSSAGTTIDIFVADQGEPGIRVGLSGAIVGTAVSATDSSMPGVRLGTSPSGLTIDVAVPDTPNGVRVAQSPAQAAVDVIVTDAPTGVRAGTSSATVTVAVAIADSGSGIRTGSSPAILAIDVLVSDGSAPPIIVGVSPGVVSTAGPPIDTTITDAPVAGIIVGVSGARVLIASSPYPPIYIPELDLMALQRDATHLMIEADPTTIALIPRDMTTKSRTGGQYREDMPARDPQVFKLIAMSYQEKPVVTPDGQERIINYTLLGDWDAVVEIGDHWTDGEFRYEVVSIEDGHGYETKALVERHG